jgi:hypothetical protein
MRAAALLALLAAQGGCWDFARLGTPKPDLGYAPGVDGGAPCNALFCEDFESGMIDPKFWMADPGVHPTQDRAIGRWSAQIVESAIGGHLLYVGTALSDQRQVYARAMFNLPVQPTASPTLMAFSDGAGHNTLAFVGQMGTLGVGSIGSTGLVVPMDQWVCLEIGLDLDTGQGRFWLNDAPVVVTTAIPSPVRTIALRFGPETAPGASYWVDEIALSGSRIGCPN